MDCGLWTVDCVYGSSMINIMQIEVLLNVLNTILAKAVYFKDEPAMNKLINLRRAVYYDAAFDYGGSLAIVKEVNTRLNRNGHPYAKEHRNQSPN